MMQPFHPVDDATASISATTTSARAAIKKPRTGQFQLRLANTGSALVRYRVGGSTVDAAATDPALPAGAVEVITVNGGRNADTHVAAKTDSGSSTLEITTGSGL